MWLEMLLAVAVANSRWWQQGCSLPSSNCLLSARALAKMYGALANKGVVDGQQVFSAELLVRPKVLL